MISLVAICHLHPFSVQQYANDMGLLFSTDNHAGSFATHSWWWGRWLTPNVARCPSTAPSAPWPASSFFLIRWKNVPQIKSQQVLEHLKYWYIHYRMTFLGVQFIWNQKLTLERAPRTIQYYSPIQDTYSQSISHRWLANAFVRSTRLHCCLKWSITSLNRV